MAFLLVLLSEGFFEDIFVYYGEAGNGDYVEKLGQHAPLRSERLDLYVSPHSLRVVLEHCHRLVNGDEVVALDAREEVR